METRAKKTAEKRIEVGTPVVVAGITLIPVTEVWRGFYRSPMGLTSFFGVKQPVDIVIVSPAGKRAFRINGEETPLDRLMEEVPGLAAVLT